MGCLCVRCTGEQSSTGLLLELMHELVELTAGDQSNSCSSDVAVQAAHCLGLIGTVDIALVTRHARRPANAELYTAVTAMRDAPQMQQYCHMFHALADYLTDSKSVLIDSFAIINVRQCLCLSIALCLFLISIFIAL